MAPSTDPAEAYLADARRGHRRRARRAAAVLLAGAAASGFLATRMTDIGHAVGFAGVAGVLAAGAVVAWFALRGGAVSSPADRGPASRAARCSRDSR